MQRSNKKETRKTQQEKQR